MNFPGIWKIDLKEDYETGRSKVMNFSKSNYFEILSFFSHTGQETFYNYKKKKFVNVL